MTIDWDLLEAAARLILPALAGAFFTYFFQRRPRLITFYGHTAVHQIDANPPIRIHTHSVVIRNVGGLPAHNVRVPHPSTVTNIFVWPNLTYQRQSTPSGGEEIVFPVIVPRQEITISYLYQPPLTFQQINQPIRSDEGMAQFRNVSLTVKLKPWLQYLVLLVFALGLLVVGYVLAALSSWFFEIVKV